MKFLFFLLAFLFMTQTSCKKEPIPIVYDHSIYNGNYYGIKKSDATEFTSESESDQILSSVVSSNQLHFNGVSFNNPTSSLPTSFSVGDLWYEGANLDFSSNFEQIGFQQRYDGGITKVDVTFDGVKTTLPITNNTEHPLRSQLEGMFILQINKHEYFNGIDVSYIDTVLITMSGYNAVIENEEYDFGVFYTYYKRNSIWNNGLEYRDLYWVEDSIYLDYKTIPSQSTGITDTIQHIFSGRRM